MVMTCKPIVGLLLLAKFAIVLGQDVILSAEFTNFRQIVNPSYELYWNFDSSTQNLSIAVRVNTTGWIGLGISPNGGMPNSDVVIGWVSGGNTIFHVGPRTHQFMQTSITYTKS